jgi:two-component sensor histidine kinase
MARSNNDSAPPSTAPASPERFLLDDLRSRQPLLAAINLAVAAAVLLALSGSEPLVPLVGWVAYLVLVQLVRVGFWFAWRHTGSEGRLGESHWLTAISAASGSAWGLAGYLFGTIPEHMAFVPFVIAGMTGGAVTALPNHPPTYFAFIWTALLPYAIRLALDPGPIAGLMALLSVAYALGISVIGYQVHRSLRRAAELSLQNIQLVQRLEAAREDLERTVAQRTQELRGANASLSSEIAERRRVEEQRELLLRELRHRVKNLLNLVLAIAYQTNAGGGTAADFIGRFEGRIHALMAAHELLTATGWKDASLAELVRHSLKLHVGDDPSRLRLDVEDVSLRPDTAQNLGLVLHELATNALKHGAWSAPGGRVELEARMIGNGDGRALELIWRETGGPSVRPPTQKGFGATLLDRAVRGRHRGEVRLDWNPAGLVCRIVLPQSGLAEAPR